MTQDCKNLLQRIRGIDLAILDAGLYLNAYESKEANDYFLTLTEERARLAEEYAKTCAPLRKDAANGSRQWINTPWPWELEAN